MPSDQTAAQSVVGDLLVNGIQLGNIWIGVQPALGVEGDPMRLLFERDLTPYAIVAFASEQLLSPAAVRVCHQAASHIVVRAVPFVQAPAVCRILQVAGAWLWRRRCAALWHAWHCRMGGLFLHFLVHAQLQQEAVHC
jgi:CobN/Magnesium Chelatase